MRREKRLISLDDVTLAQEADERGDYSDLYEAVSRLPDEIRLTVTLFYMEGYRIKEIAALMKTTESAVKNRLMRARAKLKEELGAEMEG